jgi:putative tryptophan/tyrosine transport system substrate-binding protein
MCAMKKAAASSLLIALALVAFAVTAEAQQQGKVSRIGVLETIPIELNAANFDPFRQGLRELGYIEGQNVVIEYRSADGRQERFPDLVAELIRLKVDLIVTRGTPATMAAKNATGTIPVVTSGVGDPVGAGIVASLARPGGNITGVGGLNIELYGKRVELLRELVPGVARIMGLFNMNNPSNPPQWKQVEMAADSLGIQHQLFDIRNPEDLRRGFDAAIRQRAGALVVALDALTQSNRQLIVDLAAKHRLPAIYASREFIDAGGLIAYGASFPHLYYRAATYVGRILKGAKPADLPVEQPTKLELAINLKAAKQIGLTIPPSLLARADKVIK